jgi:hypothetical protein
MDQNQKIGGKVIVFTDMFVRAMIFFMVCGLHQKAESTPSTPAVVDYEVYVDEVCNVLAKEMKDEYDLICIGTGGRMPHDVEEIGMLFDCHRSVAIDEARELELIIMRRMVELVNQHEKIRPFLREFPFPLSRADIQLSFPRMNDLGVSNIDCSFLARGNLMYYTYDFSEEKLQKVHVEPLEDALKIFESSPRKFIPKSKKSL